MFSNPLNRVRHSVTQWTGECEAPTEHKECNVLCIQLTTDEGEVNIFISSECWNEKLPLRLEVILLEICSS